MCVRGGGERRGWVEGWVWLWVVVGVGGGGWVGWVACVGCGGGGGGGGGLDVSAMSRSVSLHTHAMNSGDRTPGCTTPGVPVTPEPWHPTSKWTECEKHSETP